MKKIILDIYNKILEYDKIIIMRHIRPDGDAVGSTQGLRELLKYNFPDKKISLIANDKAEYLSFCEKEDKDVSKKEYKESLGIVIDTGTADRISNDNYSLCKEIIKIDHHIDDVPYGDVQWVEDERASASEMIAELSLSLKDKLKMNKEAATFLYMGIVTDTGRFKFGVENGITLNISSKLVKYGVDIETLYSNLYTSDFSEFTARNKITGYIRQTPNGVLYLHITNDMKKEFGISTEEASNMNSLMDSIKGSLIWLAFIENDDGESTRVRLRSRFVGVKDIASKHHGGGHEKASGATVYSPEEMQELINEADVLLGKYKKKHKGLL